MGSHSCTGSPWLKSVLNPRAAPDYPWAVPDFPRGLQRANCSLVMLQQTLGSQFPCSYTQVFCTKQQPGHVRSPCPPMDRFSIESPIIDLLLIFTYRHSFLSANAAYLGRRQRTSRRPYAHGTRAAPASCHSRAGTFLERPCPHRLGPNRP